MAIFRSLKTLISKTKKNTNRNPNSNYTLSRTFFNLSSSSVVYTSSPVFISRRPLLSRSSNFLSPISSVVGPLFLSSPPWKLSQSATPLLLQSDAVSFFKAHAFTFLRKPSAAFSYDLGFQVSSDQSLLLGTKKINNNENNVVDNKNCGDKRDEITAAVKVTDSYINFPNFISLSRLLSGPLLAWMITQEMYSLAFIGLAISGATDWLDGYMARKMGINSVVGSYLDPLADKVLIGFVALSMVEKGLLHPGLVALVVLRDVALVGGAVYMRASSLRWEWKSWNDFFNLDGTRPQKVEPLLLSKVNTFFQLVLVAAALLQPEFGNEETQSYITYLSWLVALTTVSSTAAYGAQHLKSRTTTIRKIS